MPNYTDDDKKEALRRYTETNESIRTICGAIGCSETTFYKWVKEAGVPLRGAVTGPREGGPPPPAGDEAAEQPTTRLTPYAEGDPKDAVAWAPPPAPEEPNLGPNLGQSGDTPSTPKRESEVGPNWNVPAEGSGSSEKRGQSGVQSGDQSSGSDSTVCPTCKVEQVEFDPGHPKVGYTYLCESAACGSTYRVVA